MPDSITPPPGYVLDPNKPINAPTSALITPPPGYKLDSSPSVVGTNQDPLHTGPLADFVGGIGSEAAGTGTGIYDIARKVFPSLPPVSPDIQQLTQPPASLAGHLGSGLTQAAEFMLPGAAVGKGVDAVRALTEGPGILSKVLPYAARVLGEGASAAGVEGLRSGGDPNQMLTSGLEGAGAAAAAPVIPKVIKSVSDIWGKASGVGGEALRTGANAIEPVARRAYVQAMRDPNAETRILSDFKSAVQNIKAQRAAQYQQGINGLDQTIKLNLQQPDQELQNQLANYRIGTNGPRTKINWQNSHITNNSDRQLVQNAIKDMNKWQDLSPTGLDALKQRLYNYGQDATPQSAPFFYRLGSAVTKELDSNVPGYKEMTANYAKASDLLKTISDLSPDAANPGTTIRKLANSLNQNNDYRRIVLEALDNAAGSHLKQQVAGAASRSIMPRGLAGVAAGTPLALGYMLHNPALAGASVFASPRVAGETMAAISALRRMTPNAIKAANYSPLIPAALAPSPGPVTKP